MRIFKIIFIWFFGVAVGWEPTEPRLLTPLSIFLSQPPCGPTDRYPHRPIQLPTFRMTYPPTFSAHFNSSSGWFAHSHSAYHISLQRSCCLLMWRRCQVSGFAKNGGGKTVVHKNAAWFSLESSQALHFIIIYYLLPLLQLAALPAVNLITQRRLLLPSFNHSNCNKLCSGCFTAATYLYSSLFRQVVKCEIIWWVG